MAVKQSWQCDLCKDNYHHNFSFKIMIDKKTGTEIKVCEECKPELFLEEKK